MTPKRIEHLLRTVAAFSEAGSDMCDEDDQKHAGELFKGAGYIFKNAAQLSNAGKLMSALADLMRDYNEQYQILTDGQYGREPGTPPWRRAKRLLNQLKK